MVILKSAQYLIANGIFAENLLIHWNYCQATIKSIIAIHEPQRFLREISYLLKSSLICLQNIGKSFKFALLTNLPEVEQNAQSMASYKA